MTIVIVRGKRRSGRTTEALKWLGEGKFGLYVVGTIQEREAVRHIAPKNVKCVTLAECDKREYRLRGYHFDRVVLDNRDFYQPEEWFNAEEQLLIVTSPNGVVREIREERAP